MLVIKSRYLTKNNNKIAKAHLLLLLITSNLQFSLIVKPIYIYIQIKIALFVFNSNTNFANFSFRFGGLVA